MKAKPDAVKRRQLSEKEQRTADAAQECSIESFLAIKLRHLHAFGIAEQNTNPAPVSSLHGQKVYELRVLLWQEQHRVGQQVNLSVGAVKETGPKRPGHVCPMGIGTDDFAGWGGAVGGLQVGAGPEGFVVGVDEVGEGPAMAGAGGAAGEPALDGFGVDLE